MSFSIGSSLSLPIYISDSETSDHEIDKTYYPTEFVNAFSLPIPSLPNPPSSPPLDVGPAPPSSNPMSSFLPNSSSCMSPESPPLLPIVEEDKDPEIFTTKKMTETLQQKMMAFMQEHWNTDMDSLKRAFYKAYPEYKGKRHSVSATAWRCYAKINAVANGKKVILKLDSKKYKVPICKVLDKLVEKGEITKKTPNLIERVRQLIQENFPEWSHIEFTRYQVSRIVNHWKKNLLKEKSLDHTSTVAFPPSLPLSSEEDKGPEISATKKTTEPLEEKIMAFMQERWGSGIPNKRSLQKDLYKVYPEYENCQGKTYKTVSRVFNTCYTQLEAKAREKKVFSRLPDKFAAPIYEVLNKLVDNAEITKETCITQTVRKLIQDKFPQWADIEFTRTQLYNIVDSWKRRHSRPS